MIQDSTLSVWHGVTQVARFGVGSIVGMTMLAIITGLPAARSARGLRKARAGRRIALPANDGIAPKRVQCAYEQDEPLT